MLEKLTHKQTLFCDYYIKNGGNASDAYRKSYNCKNSTEKTICECACKLLKKPNVAARLQKVREAQEKKSEITKDAIIQELKCIAFADIRDFIEIKEGILSVKDTSTWTYEMSKAVEGVKNTKEGIELRLNGKSWSIARICKMLGYDAATKIDITNFLTQIDTGTD